MSAPVSPRTLRRQWLGVVGRLLIVPVVLTAFAAPSAGHIGSSCDDNAGPDPVQHCLTKGEIQCQRQTCRMYSNPQSNCVPDPAFADTARQFLNSCVDVLGDTCGGAVWAPNCQPTQMQVDACYDALYTNPFQEDGDNPPQCQTLCSGG